MFKFGFLMLTALFSLYDSELKVENNYQAIIEKINIEADQELVEKNEKFEVVKKNHQFSLKYDSNWVRELPNIEISKHIVNNQNYLIFYYLDNYLYLIEYNSAGAIVFHDKIIDNKIFSVFDVIVNGDIYIVGSVNEYTNTEFINAAKNKVLGRKDAFIVQINNYEITQIKILGGVLDESFIRISGSQDGFYVVGKKDILSGGDFGNGGRENNTVFVAKLDLSFEVITFIILASSRDIIMLEFYKDYLYLSLSDSLYKFDESLRIIHRVSYPEQIIYSVITPLNKIISFSKNSGYLYNIYDLELNHQFIISINDQLKKIIKFDKIIYLKTSDSQYYFDMAYLSKFTVFDYYYPQLDFSPQVNTLFNEAKLVSETSDPIFNPLIFGVYQITYTYENEFGLKFNIIRDIEVLKEANVSEGVIYPVGYKLNFTGNAFLNGKSIFNNYTLTDSGEYQLKLYGVNDSVQEISFYVDKFQLKFEEFQVKDWDLELQRNEVFFIDFTFEAKIDYQIKGVLLNNEEYSNLVIDRVNKIISVKMNSPNTPGLYHYYLDCLYYYDQNDIRSVQINQMFIVNVLKDDPVIYINQSDAHLFNITINDPMISVRYFEVKIASNKEDIINKYSLNNQNLVFSGLNSKLEYLITISIVYDIGNFTYPKIELVQARFIGTNSINVGEIEIIQRSESLDSFKLSLNRKTNLFTQILADNKVIYEKVENSYLKSIIFSLFSFVIVGFVSYQMKVFIQKKRKRFI